MHRAPDPCGGDVSCWSKVVPGSDWGPVPGSGKLGFPAFQQGKGAMWGAAGPHPAWGAGQQCPRGLAGAHRPQLSLWGCRSFAGSIGDMHTRH